MEQVRMKVGQILDARAALSAVMGVRGMPREVQLNLVRLWQRLGRECEAYAICEESAAKEYGHVDNDGRVNFATEEAKGEYLAQIRRLRQAEVEITPEAVASCAGLWNALSPMDLAALENCLRIAPGECGEETR